MNEIFPEYHKSLDAVGLSCLTRPLSHHKDKDSASGLGDLSDDDEGSWEFA